MSAPRRLVGMKPSTLALTLGATVRLTRFVVTDQLGEWLIHEPIDRARERYIEDHYAGLVADLDAQGYDGMAAVDARLADRGPWWWKYREGLDCQWCIGYWVGAGVLASAAVAGHTRAWRFVAGSLALNVAANAVAGLPALDLYSMADDHDEDGDVALPLPTAPDEEPTA